MDIRKIERGEIITEPGIYDMPIDWYHSDCCDGPSISSTGLRTMILKSPMHYWANSYLNPDRIEPDADDTEAAHFRIGRAAHFRLLEGEGFAERFAIRPALWENWMTKAAKEWRRDAQAAGLTVLTPDELALIDSLAKTLRAQPLHGSGLLGGLVEMSMIVRDRKTGIWLKSRPDSIPIDDAMADLKVVADAHPDTFARTVKSLGYDMQMALAGICFEKLEGRTIDQFWLVPIERKAPHGMHVATLSHEVVHWARIKIRRAIDQMANGLRTGDWPGYGLDGAEVSLLDFERDRMVRLQKAGLLPPDDGDDF